MGGHHVAERRRIVDHVVPGRLEAGFARKAVERQVRREPGRIFEPADRRRVFQNVGRQKRGRGEDQRFGDVFGVSCSNAPAAPSRVMRYTVAPVFT